MGGDDAPATPLEAAAIARRAGIEVRLCGPSTVVGPDGLHAPERIAMDEDPAFTLRARPRASIRVAARAVAEGRAVALVSAGPTGATVGAALLELGREPGIRRPVVAARLDVGGRHVVLCDVGAAVDPDASTLASHAGLGRDYARRLGIAEPRIGLLNIATEPGRGTAVVKEAAGLLAELDGFIGSVEPAGVLAGAADVVVTDGFTGNLVLKTLEAAAGTGHGGDRAAVVLGVRGTVLVAHGAASATDLAHAVRWAATIGGSDATADDSRGQRP